MAQNSTSLNRNFNKQLKKYIKNSSMKGTKAIRGVGLQALKMVMIKSPVDEGTFRGNWNVGINTIDGTLQDGYTRKPKFGQFDQQAYTRGNERIGSFKNGDKINISNSLPYANRLEYTDWSAQSTGMVRTTLMELIFWLKAQNKKV